MPSTWSDAAFLAEVDDFLTACDLPTFPTIQSLYLKEDDSCDSSTASAHPEPAAPQPQPTCKRRKNTNPKATDAATKRELEKAKDRKRRSAYRERRRVERETLQQQVGELSAELTELEKTNTRDKLASLSWKVIAERQLQARLSAEKEQRELVTAIDSRAAMIQEFKTFVHTRLSKEVALVEDVEDELDGELYKRKKIRLEPSDAEFYEVYLQELDAIYAQTDDNLRACGLDSTDLDEEDHKHQWKEDGETGYFLYGNKNVLPFDFQKTCRYTWRAAQMAHRQEDREGFDNVVDPENTAAFKFRVTTRLKSGRVVSVFQRVVVRRYKEKNRQVIVWRSFTEGEGMFTGMHADESGCCVATPIESTTTTGTLTRTFMRHIPMHFSRTVAQEPTVKQFAGLMLTTGTQDTTEISNRLQKLLLEDA